MPPIKLPEMAHKYNEAMCKVVIALAEMTAAMVGMGGEHVHFQNYFFETQKRIQDMKKEYAPKELDAETIRSTALDCYLSASNVPKVTSIGHYQVEIALDKFNQQEKELDEIRKKTAELVDSLLGDRDSKKGDGHGVKAESADEIEYDMN